MCSWLTLLIPCRWFGNIDIPDTIVGYALMSSMYVESHILEVVYLPIVSHSGKISGLYFVDDMLFETNGRIYCLKNKKSMYVTIKSQDEKNSIRFLIIRLNHECNMHSLKGEIEEGFLCGLLKHEATIVEDMLSSQKFVINNVGVDEFAEAFPRRSIYSIRDL